MEENKSSLTARVSAFSRAYHAKKYTVKVFNDTIAEKLLTEEEYNTTAQNMARGIAYFNPGFKGTPEEALEFVVSQQLAPSTVGRSAFTESKLEEAVKNEGIKQYCIFAAGFDSFAYRQPEWAKGLEIFEIDHPATSEDKQKRVKTFCNEEIKNLSYIEADFTVSKWEKALLEHKKYKDNVLSFCSVLGISYYLSKGDFEKLIEIISKSVAKGSKIIFDYPVIAEMEEETDQVKRQKALAKEAQEGMQAEYSKEEMEKLLMKHGFKVVEHLIPKEITEKFFSAYNNAKPLYKMRAFDKVNYCYASLEIK